MSVRVLAYCPDPLDGTAYWRVASPLSRLRAKAGDFEYEIVGKINHNQLLNCDVLLLQRPFLDEHVAAAQIAHVLGKPVWCDWDDDILGVPQNNGRTITYNKAKHKQNVRLLAAAADVVTVTCEELAKRMKMAGARAPMIIPNALDPSLDLPPEDDERLPVRVIAWRGGDSHNEDLLTMGDAFPRVAQEFDGDVLWHFIGFNPYWLLNSFPAESVIVHQWVGNTISYLRFMAKLRPSFLAVPLADTKFNRAKSNISVLEAAWMGAVAIAPAWLEGCALDGVLTYSSKTEWEARLREAAGMPEGERLERLARVRADIKKQYDLDLVNLIRALALKRLLNGRRVDTWTHPNVSPQLTAALAEQEAAQ